MSDAEPYLTCTALVIGAGPGGYVAAIRLGQLGVDTVLVDAGTVGGTCLNIGCIPSKALIHAADEFAVVAAAAHDGRYGLAPATIGADMPATTTTVRGVVDRLTSGVTGLVDKAGVRRVTGRAEIVDGKTVNVREAGGAMSTFRAEHLVIATGSTPAELSALPFDGERVISSTEGLFLDELPARLLIVGAGYIGLELGTAFAKLGSSVTVVELLDRILPQYDAKLTRPVASRLKELGVDVRLGTGVDTFDVGDFDKVLVTVGRTPATAGFGLESLELAMSGRYVAVDGECRTSMRNVWAIGDVTGEPMLAHRAMAQGELVAELIASSTGGEPARHTLAFRVIPAVCYTDPQIVTAGMAPDDATAAGIDAVVGIGNFGGNGRALTLGRRDGFVRVVARRDNHAVLGLQAVGAEVSEFATTFAMALELGCVLEDVATVVPAHPTLGEALQEAVFTALGRSLHS